MNADELEKLVSKFTKLLKVESDELRCYFMEMPDAEWQAWRKNGEGILDDLLGFSITRNLSLLIRFCEVHIQKMNLGQYSTERKLGKIYTKASEESKIIINWLMGEKRIRIMD